jgi:hypothetical protein
MGRVTIVFLLHVAAWLVAYVFIDWHALVLCVLISASWASIRFARSYLAHQATIASAARRDADASTTAVPGGNVSFKAMSLTMGEDEEFALRRLPDARWEGRPVSASAVAEVVARRLASLTDKEHGESVVKFAELTADKMVPGDSGAAVPIPDLCEIMKELPVGTQGRKVARELVEEYFKKALSEEDFAKLCSGHTKVEMLQAIQDMTKDNDGFERLPSQTESIVETAYQRYIHHT